jgi:hypothetical protein
MPRDATWRRAWSPGLLDGRHVTVSGLRQKGPLLLYSPIVENRSEGASFSTIFRSWGQFPEKLWRKPDPVGVGPRGARAWGLMRVRLDPDICRMSYAFFWVRRARGRWKHINPYVGSSVNVVLCQALILYSLSLLKVTHVKCYTRQILSYKISNFCKHILKIGANDASG